jgi:hypothetical protein
MRQIEAMWIANVQVYGAENDCMPMNSDGMQLARCNVERIMGRMGTPGAFSR